jgi:hypothetical protein
MGYTEELKAFTDSVSGQSQPALSLDEVFSTMTTIFALERALATAQAVNV